MNSPRLLIVESDERAALEIGARLAALGYGVVGPCSSLDRAMHEARHTLPDLVVLNISLSGKYDGYEAAAHIRSVVDCAVLYLVDDPEFARNDPRYRAEPYAYLVQPVSEFDLHRTVEMTLYKHRTERELLLSDRRLKQALGYADLGLWEWDIESGSAVWEEQVYEILGYRPGEIGLGLQAWKELVHPEDWSLIRRAFWDHVNGKAPKYEVEYRVRAKDTDWRWVSAGGMVSEWDTSGKPVKVTGTIRDVTQRRLAEIRSQHSLHLLDTVLSSLNEAVLVVDPKTRMIHECNRAIVEMFGYSKGELLGKDTDMLHVNSEMSAAWGAESGSDIRNRGRFSGEFSMRRKNGEIFPTEQYIVPIYDGDEIGLQVHTIRDVSERKLTERLLVIQRDLSTRLSAESNLEAALKTCIDAVHGMSGIDAAGIHLLNEVGTIDAAVRRGISGGVVQCTHRRHGDLLVSDLTCRTGPLYGSVTNEPEHVCRALIDEGLHSFGSVPILHEGRLIASLNVASRYWDSLPDRIRRALESVAGVIGSAIARIRAEEALRWSEATYRAIFENAAIGIDVLDPDFRVAEANATFIKMLGYSAEELRTLSPIDITHPDDREESLCNLEALKSGLVDRYHQEKRYRKRDGTMTWVDLTVSAIRDEQGRHEGTIGVIMDITERKRGEEALTRAKEEWELTFDAIPDLIVILDERQRITRANRAMVEGFGLPLSELEHKQCYEIFHQSDGPPDFCPFSRSAVDGHDHSEIVYIDRADKYFHVTTSPLRDGQGAFRGCVHVARDITERRLADTALKASESRYRAVFNNAAVGIVTMAASGAIATCNSAFQSVLGYSEEELKDRLFVEIIHPDDAEAFRDAMGILFDGETDSVMMEHRCRCKDGRIKWGHLWFSAMRDQEGVADGYLGVLSDVTERKRNEELLLQSERLKAVGVLAGGVAHNFNNMLQIVIGNAQLGLYGLEGGSTEEVRETLNQILESARFGAGIVKRLQNFAGGDAERSGLKHTVFDLSEIVGKAVEMSSVWWKTERERDGALIHIEQSLTPRCFVFGNQSGIFEVAVNLIKNAVEAVPEGGLIGVETTVRDAWAVLNVRDNGNGIVERDLGKIFQPFFTTKGVQSTGLGLASSLGIVNDHGGEIRVTSAPGRGAVFTVKLPLSDEQGSEGPTTFLEFPKGLSVLLVDDVPAVLAMLRRSLENFCRKVFTATSGDRAVEVFASETIDLVICDLGMPGMNGWEVASRIKKLCLDRGSPKVPFIILTGWRDEPTDGKRLKDSGVDAVVHKPMHLSELSRTVLSLVRKSS